MLILLKEFKAYYTLDSAMTWETIIATEDVLKEVVKKIKYSNYFTVTNDKGGYVINISLIRYICVRGEKGYLNIIRFLEC